MRGLSVLIPILALLGAGSNFGVAAAAEQTKTVKGKILSSMIKGARQSRLVTDTRQREDFIHVPHGHVPHVHVTFKNAENFAAAAATAAATAASDTYGTVSGKVAKLASTAKKWGVEAGEKAATQVEKTTAGVGEFVKDGAAVVAANVAKAANAAGAVATTAVNNCPECLAAGSLIADNTRNAQTWTKESAGNSAQWSEETASESADKLRPIAEGAGAGIVTGAFYVNKYAGNLVNFMKTLIGQMGCAPSPAEMLNLFKRLVWGVNADGQKGGKDFFSTLTTLLKKGAGPLNSDVDDVAGKACYVIWQSMETAGKLAFSAAFKLAMLDGVSALANTCSEVSANPALSFGVTVGHFGPKGAGSTSAASAGTEVGIAIDFKGNKMCYVSTSVNAGQNFPPSFTRASAGGTLGASLQFWPSGQLLDGNRETVSIKAGVGGAIAGVNVGLKSDLSLSFREGKVMKEEPRSFGAAFSVTASFAIAASPITVGVGRGFVRSNCVTMSGKSCGAIEDKKELVQNPVFAPAQEKCNPEKSVDVETCQSFAGALTKSGAYGVGKLGTFVITNSQLPHGCQYFYAETPQWKAYYRVVFNNANADRAPFENKMNIASPVCKTGCRLFDSASTRINACPDVKLCNTIDEELCYELSGAASKSGAYGKGKSMKFLNTYSELPHGCQYLLVNKDQPTRNRVIFNQANNNGGSLLNSGVISTGTAGFENKAGVPNAHCTGTTQTQGRRGRGRRGGFLFNSGSFTLASAKYTGSADKWCKESASLPMCTNGHNDMHQKCDIAGTTDCYADDSKNYGGDGNWCKKPWNFPWPTMCQRWYTAAQCNWFCGNCPSCVARGGTFRA